MKSRIAIALTQGNEPVIELKFDKSDDVRDVLVKQFIDKLKNGFNVGLHSSFVSNANESPQILEIIVKDFTNEKAEQSFKGWLEGFTKACEMCLNIPSIWHYTMNGMVYFGMEDRFSGKGVAYSNYSSKDQSESLMEEIKRIWASEPKSISEAKKDTDNIG